MIDQGSQSDLLILLVAGLVLWRFGGMGRPR